MKNIKIKNQKVIKFFSYIVILVMAVFILRPTQAHASTLSLTPTYNSYSVGDNLRVKVTVGSASSINAVSGRILFPSDLLSMTSISKAGSIVSLWAQEPSYSNASGSASFEGVILNGYSGQNGTIITLIFKVKSPGTAHLDFDKASVLANDGNGTETLTSKNGTTITIKSSATLPKATTEPQAPLVDTNIKIEEIKSANSADPQRFLITPPDAVKNNTYNVSIDSLSVVSWVDDGSHIFTIPTVSSGIHTLRLTATSASGANLIGFVEFSTIIVMTPVITDYPVDLEENNFLVLKGTADPLTDIQISLTNLLTSTTTIDHVMSNDKGQWSFVSDNKMTTGQYSIKAMAITHDGIASASTNPLTIVVKEKPFNTFMSMLNKYLTIVTPIIALLVLLIMILIYGFYYIRRLNKYLARKLLKTETIVEKSFEILEEDVSEEVAIFKKLKAGKVLTASEKTFVAKFKKDIEAAEELILKEVKSIKRPRRAKKDL